MFVRPLVDSGPRDRTRELQETNSGPARPMLLASTSSQRLRFRNRALGLVLAGVAATGFATVMMLAVVVHYAEVHHLLATL
jgi:hypothetical protein